MWGEPDPIGVIVSKSSDDRIRVDRSFYLIKHLLKPGEVLTLTSARPLGRRRVFLSGLRRSDGELVIVAGDPFEPEAIRSDGLRWEVETLLGCLNLKTSVEPTQTPFALSPVEG